MKRAGPIRSGVRGSSDLSAYLLEVGRPSAPAVVDMTGTTSYADLHRLARRVAGALRDSGVPRRSRIGIIAPNSVWWIAAYLAALSYGVAVPVSERLSPAEASAQLAGADCSAVVTTRTGLRPYLDAIPTGVPVVLADELDCGDEYWPAETNVSPSGEAALMFTSGSTAAPRAVRVSAANIVANTEAINSYLRLRPEDRVLALLPFHYCFGTSLVHTHLRAGASISPAPSFAFPQMAVEQLSRDGCTVFAGVPSTFETLAHRTNFLARAWPRLRLLQQAGGRMRPGLIREFVEHLPDAEFHVMYGQTEATARLTHLPPELVTAKPGSIGRPVQSVSVRVADARGGAVPDGAIGELVARGESICAGYLGDSSESASKFRGGELWTGDLGYRDADGDFFIVGRNSDFVKSWGVRVSCPQVESAALEVREVRQAALVGVPDRDAGELMVLFVCLAGESDRDAAGVRRELSTRLSRQAVPHRVVILSDLPLNASGKIDKDALRRYQGVSSGRRNEVWDTQ